MAQAEAAAMQLIEELMAARHGRIVVYGVGREGLAMKGFLMRLHHMGLQVSLPCHAFYACTLSCPQSQPITMLTRSRLLGPWVALLLSLARPLLSARLLPLLPPCSSLLPQ